MSVAQRVGRAQYSHPVHYTEQRQRVKADILFQIAPGEFWRVRISESQCCIKREICDVWVGCKKSDKHILFDKSKGVSAGVRWLFEEEMPGFEIKYTYK